MIIRIIGGILVVAAASGIGHTMSRNLSLRMEELKRIKSMILMLRGEIRYAHTPLTEAFSILSGRMEEPYREFLKELSKTLYSCEAKSIEKAAKECGENYLKGTHLFKEDMQRLFDFIGRMGYLDGDMQLSGIELYLEELEETYRQAEENRVRNGRLYQCLGAAGGLFLVLILWR